MKNKILVSLTAFILVFTACQKSDFAESYTDPSKIANTTVEKQFTGFLNSNKDWVLPAYTNYFVVLRITLNRFNQAVGWANNSRQYVPGAGAVNDRWNNFYNFLNQFRELEKVNAQLSADDQADRRIYMIAATMYFYDHTQRVVDLHGDIPWSAAGKLSTNGGDYEKSYAKYDAADAIYTKMLDDLKAFSDELNSMTIKAAILTGFKTQDIVNRGDITLWKRYCNSLRLRMLTRVSGVTAFQSRANSEIAAILADATKYPIVTKNTENIQINVFDIAANGLNANGFRTGLEDWNGNIAGKAMIDHMKKGADPRLRALFEPGLRDSAKVYNGLDPMLNENVQTTAIADGKLSIYNRSTLTRNQYCPGVVINAAEVSLILAEYYSKANNDAAAKTAYENAIKQSIEFYYNIRALSNDNTAGALTPRTAAEEAAYITSADVNWATNADKISLIATQKWLHFNVMQAYDSWAELRRLDSPKFNFQVDNTDPQTQPPVRWLLPASETIYNAENYNTVKGKDNLTTKIFWDTK
jgi:Starch-binding associating with outer membrane